MNTSIEDNMELTNDEVKQIQIDALIYLKRYLEEKNLSYFMVAGTLLGSVRHEGFIPWDDDVDIGMPRKDYDKFIEVFNKDTKNIKKYFLQNWKSEDNFSMPFSKLRVNKTIYIEEATDGVQMHNGIYIDIFPFDNVYENLFLKKIQKKASKYISQLILLKSDYKIPSTKLIQGIRLLVKLIPKKVFIWIFESINKNASENSMEMVCTGGSYGFDKEIVQKKWFVEKNDLKFEKIYLPAPKLYKNYLKNLYGNYEILPPEKDRISRHKIIKKKILK